MRMEVEGSNIIQPPSFIQVLHCRQRGNLIGSFDDCGTETKAILHGCTEPFHQGTRVPAEALLARHKRITVVGVLNITLLEIGGDTDIMVRPQNQAGTFPCEKLSNRIYFLRSSFLLGNQVIKTKYHQRICVFEYPLVKRKFLP